MELRGQKPEESRSYLSAFVSLSEPVHARGYKVERDLWRAGHFY